MSVWTMTCLHCGTLNTVSGQDVPANCKINCSICNEPLGVWEWPAWRIEEGFAQALAESAPKKKPPRRRGPSLREEI